MAQLNRPRREGQREREEGRRRGRKVREGGRERGT